MKKKVLTIILLLIFCVALKVLFFSVDKKSNFYSLNNEQNSISVMVYDDESEEYKKQETIPIGDYELNEELSYCEGKGYIEDYDSELGVVTTRIKGSDLCYFYFDEAALVLTTKDFYYTGKEETLTLPASGDVKIEVWGAQGGNSTSTYYGGYGAYSVGTINLKKGTTLYINVGEQGVNCGRSTACSGSYNGGGDSKGYTESSSTAASGGGATHVALVSGLLSTLESHKNDNKILIVAGGGGGGHYTNGLNYGIGGHGGGISGNNATSLGSDTNKPSDSNTYPRYSNPGTQTAGGCTKGNTHCGSFGQGGNASSYSETYGSGGGAGYYGGSGAQIGPGSGGSGYIGNTNLKDKHMTCYNCTTSTETATKTNSNTCVNATATSDCSKTGNGHVRITYLSTEVVQPITVTRSILDQGTFVNVTPTYLTNQVDGADGFTIVGTATNNTNATCNGAQWYQWNYFLRWDYQIDLTNYSTIKYYARKNANHGVVRVYITDGMHYDPVCDGSTNVLLKQEVHYNDLPTSWTEYTIDVSGITGTRTISFIGGYVDSTGYSSSSTSYSNIRFLP